MNASNSEPMQVGDPGRDGRSRQTNGFRQTGSFVPSDGLGKSNDYGKLISIPRVAISPGRMRVFVHIEDGAPRQTTDDIAAKACEAYPTLPIHSCINSKGPTFGDVMGCTSIPHLLEHLIIAEQARSLESAGEARSDVTLVGTTQWVSKCDAVTEVNFVDDLEAVAALNRVHAFLEGLLADCASSGQPGLSRR